MFTAVSFIGTYIERASVVVVGLENINYENSTRIVFVRARWSYVAFGVKLKLVGALMQFYLANRCSIVRIKCEINDVTPLQHIVYSVAELKTHKIYFSTTVILSYVFSAALSDSELTDLFLK